MIGDQRQVNRNVEIAFAFPQTGMHLLMKHSVHSTLHTDPVWQSCRKHFPQPITRGCFLQLLTGRLNAQTMGVGIRQHIQDVIACDARILQIKRQVPTNHLHKSVQDLLGTDCSGNLGHGLGHGFWFPW